MKEVVRKLSRIFLRYYKVIEYDELEYREINDGLIAETDTAAVIIASSIPEAMQILKDNMEFMDKKKLFIVVPLSVNSINDYAVRYPAINRIPNMIPVLISMINGTIYVLRRLNAKQ